MLAYFNSVWGYNNFYIVNQKEKASGLTFTTWFIWLIIWKRHLRQCNVKSVKNMLWRNENHKHLQKNQLYFLVPGWKFQYFRYLLQNPNIKLMASFPNNHYLSYTFLNPWALNNKGVCKTAPTTRGMLKKDVYI